MVVPLDSARWTAFPEAVWACLNGICSEKQRPQSVTRQLGCFSKEKMDVLSFWDGCFHLGQCNLNPGFLGCEEGRR